MDTQPILSLSLTPPISVPFRFLFTAPLFGVLAGAVFITYGPEAMLSRWTPASLAVTHMITLGYISMVMLGALFQITPVLIGSPIPKPHILSPVLHGLFVIGVLCLTTGLLLTKPPLLFIAILCLGLAVFIFLVVVIYCLLRAPVNQEYTLFGLLLALIALLETLALALWLAGSHASGVISAMATSWTNVHLGFGLIGWIGLTLMSTAFVVVPMFQVTPPYPQWIKRGLPTVLLLCLAIWAFVYSSPVVDNSLRYILHSILTSIIALSLALFAVVTLYLQSKRHVDHWDVTVWFWRFSMLMLLCCILLWVIGLHIESLSSWGRYEYLLGILYIIGFTVSAINGMLYKIVPFLIWLHLQQTNIEFKPIPNMKKIIPQARGWRHLMLHVSAVLLMICAVLNPRWFIYPAMSIFIVSTMHLYINLVQAMRVYTKTKIELRG